MTDHTQSWQQLGWLSLGPGWTSSGLRGPAVPGSRELDSGTVGAGCPMALGSSLGQRGGWLSRGWTQVAWGTGVPGASHGQSGGRPCCELGGCCRVAWGPRGPAVPSPWSPTFGGECASHPRVWEPAIPSPKGPILGDACASCPGAWGSSVWWRNGRMSRSVEGQPWAGRPEPQESRFRRHGDRPSQAPECQPWAARRPAVPGPDSSGVGARHPGHWGSGRPEPLGSSLERHVC